MEKWYRFYLNKTVKIDLKNGLFFPCPSRVLALTDLLLHPPVSQDPANSSQDGSSPRFLLIPKGLSLSELSSFILICVFKLKYDFLVYLMCFHG